MSSPRRTWGSDQRRRELANEAQRVFTGPRRLSQRRRQWHRLPAVALLRGGVRDELSERAQVHLADLGECHGEEWRRSQADSLDWKDGVAVRNE